MVGAIAAGFGYFARAVIVLVRALPGLLGPGIVVLGIWQFDPRIATIVGGLALWAYDLVSGRASSSRKDAT